MFVTLTLNPLPERERDFNPAPLLPDWEKGLGDEGKSARVTCSPPSTPN
jgi:hypothetical protein